MPATAVPATSTSTGPTRPGPLARVSFWLGTLVVAGLFAAGAWQRRWIADDGLIVLRTVRNLAAGNGPVFNVGERVESNTSTLWTYLVWAVHAVTGYRVELSVLGLALTLSVAAVVLGMLGTRVLLGGARRGPAVLLPLGMLVYAMLPPARDFATSGLETGLIVFWIAGLWLLTQLWARAPHRSRRLGLPAPLTAATAFWAGLAPLVRPEMLLLGAAVLGLLAVARQSWAHLLWLVPIAGAVPVAYQLWRMSYYGLPYPITAVAKDAGGAKWDKGLAYLWDLVHPYALVVPLAVALVAGVGAAVASTAGRPSRTARRGGVVAELRERLRSPSLVTTVFLLVAAVLAVYEARVGGDFMHGRVLLPVVFLAMLPVAVVPIPRDAPRAASSAVLASWLVVVGWAVWMHLQDDPFRAAPEQVTATGIVDERQYYIQRTGHAHPLLATDYLDFPRMRALVESVRANQTGAVFIAVPTFQDRWDVVEKDHPAPGQPPFTLPEHPDQRVVFLNLGMTSANLPLDVKVYDTVGLATPLAAHTRRMEDGRIGHDKFLPYDWFLAGGDYVEDEKNYPRWIDANWVAQAKVALTCPATRAVVASYTDELTYERRVLNLKYAFDFAAYRIDRIPSYEVQRCGLPMPEKVEKHPGTR